MVGVTRKQYAAECLASMEGFVDLTFKAKTGRDFVWGDHHRQICRALDEVVDGKIRRLIINVAPRYTKTELVSKLFVAYGLAINPASRFLLLSYSEDLVLDNSRDVVEFVQSPAYQFLFPGTVPTGKSAKLWYTTRKGGVYAASTGGQVTGFGAGQVESEPDADERNEDAFIVDGSDTFAGAVIIDDPLKPEGAFSDQEREKINARFENTIRSRVNSRKTPIIVIMQRLHERDLCGYLQEVEPGEWTVLSLPCIITDPDGTRRALWPFKDTLEELDRQREVDAVTFDTQKMQNPKPREGLMYPSGFRTYKTLPVEKYQVCNYTDTADTGADFLCSITYAKTDSAIYVLDVIYDNSPMEVTEPATARMLARNKVSMAVIESNNGGRSFRRNVERLTRQLGNIDTRFQDLTQSQNKDARIFTNSARVSNVVFMPEGWERMWPAFAKALNGYRKEGRNAHDDAPDALTGCVEMSFTLTGNYSFSVIR